MSEHHTETTETTETTVEKPVLSDPAEEKRVSLSEPAKETTETTTETTTSEPA